MLRLFGTTVFLVIGWGSAAVPPPNDNFAYRTVLQGNWLTFTGSLAGATSEEPCIPTPVFPLPDNGDVWWSWTAADSWPVTLMVERLSFWPASGYGPDSLSVALFPGASSNNACGPSVVATMPLHLANPIATMTFMATSGTTYQIVLQGSKTNVFRMQLMATNPPIVVEQPRSLTVSPGACALLTVIAAGVRPFGYQWRFNGNDLAGETSPMLALTNVLETNAGVYSVLVSNATGTVSSDAASLTVNEGEIPSELRPLRSTAPNRFAFELLGEVGRFYRIESSTNLVTWQPEKSFADPRPPYAPYFATSVLFQFNASSFISIPASSPHKFYRAVRYAPADERCNLHLKQQRFAKELWVRDYHKADPDTPQGTELAAYMKNLPVAFCPSSGGYHWPMSVLLPPLCTTPRAVLEEPR